MKGIGRIIKWRDMVFMFLRIKKNMQAIGMITDLMELASIPIKMEIFIKE